MTKFSIEVEIEDGPHEQIAVNASVYGKIFRRTEGPRYFKRIILKYVLHEIADAIPELNLEGL